MKRDEKNAVKRQAILDAALQVFCAKGFAAARVEDIAREAGVAKGTIYIHFTDKEGVFAAILDAVLAPLHSALSELLDRDELSLREQLWGIAAPLIADNGQSPAGMAIRLLHAEGLHNPSLVHPYFELISASLHRLHDRLAAAGLPQGLCDYPNLVMVPLLHGLLWQGLYGHIAPLDLRAMYAAYLESIGV